MDEAAKIARKKKRAKNIRLVVVVLLFMFVPLAVTGLILAMNANDDLSQGSITAVTVASGKDSWEVKDGEEIRFFISVVKEGASIDETAAPRESYRSVKLTFHKLKTDVTYELLLSDSVKDCVFADPQGALHLIPAETAEELLAHPLITGVAISYAAVPACTVTAGEKTAECGGAGEWTYTNVDGTVTTLQPGGSDPVRAVVPAGEDLSFSFPQKPDFISVRILDGKGDMLYSGDPAEMERLSFEDDTTLSLTVSAEWYGSDSVTYRGKLDYAFDLFYDVPTLCVLNRTEARPGDVFEIRVSHSSAETVAVTATFPADQITQGRENGSLVIHVPVSAAAAPNAYSIVLMAADVDEKFEVTILAPEA